VTNHAVMFPERWTPSPNFDRTPAHERLGVIFHHSVLPFGATIERMSDSASKVSYHGLIDVDGTRARLVADEHIAWHAGASMFRGRSRCNDFMLGLAFAGDTYAAPLTAPQIASAVEWLALRWGPCGWDLERMTDHRQVSPGRKDDLNPVEWERLLAALRARFG
jgi:AmpD protein